jgi:hypothetical protein
MILILVVYQVGLLILVSLASVALFMRKLHRRSRPSSQLEWPEAPPQTVPQDEQRKIALRSMYADSGWGPVELDAGCDVCELS